MPSFSSALAHSLVHRRHLWFLATAVLVIASAIVIVQRHRLDTEILNLLPSGFDSVEALKVYSTEFAKNRELTFALLDETGKVDQEAFAEHFASMLENEPWVTRFLDRSPFEKAGGMDEVQVLALPLLLNLPGADFDAAINLLQPAELTKRLREMRQSIESGSPRASVQLQLDPLGLVGPAMKPMSGSFSMESAEPLTSKDGTLRLALVLTNQKSDGPVECRKLMETVDAFDKRVLTSWEGPAPQILVTGRTPYVAQISKGMERDIVTTLIGSVLLVAVVFYVGFRRLRPLLGIMLVLFLCCIPAIALGFIFFGTLNGITIGFCSILIGLGVDFGMLLYGSYQVARNHGAGHEAAIAAAIRQLGSGIFFAALTTAAGFLALVLSDCAGFSQLGVLIAFGILLSAGLMMTVFFLLIGKTHEPQKHDFIAVLIDRYLNVVFRFPKRVFLAGFGLLAGLSALALSPALPLRIEPNPRSLEPKNIPAGYALRKIQEKMSPAGEETLPALIQSADGDEAYRDWRKADAFWKNLVAEGKLRRANTPAAFVLSPERLRENSAKLTSLNFANIRQALDIALQAEGFSSEAFRPAMKTLDQLEKFATRGAAGLQWKDVIPESSSWWFILDKFFAGRPHLSSGYLVPNQPIRTPADKAAFAKMVTPRGVPVRLTGWSYTLADLISWAQTKLVLLTGSMLAFNIVLLVFLFRKLTPLLLLMVCLGLSIGAMIAAIKITGLPLNLFNILAFPLVLGIGVDYGIYILLATRNSSEKRSDLKTILKPVLLSALTAAAGFGSLGFAENPSLTGLGLVCAIGVCSSIFATFFFLVPAYVWQRR